MTGGAAARSWRSWPRPSRDPLPAARGTAGEAVNVVAQRAGAPPPPETLVSGIIPPLADAYFQRLQTGIDLKSGLFPGETVVLIALQIKFRQRAVFKHRDSHLKGRAIDHNFSLHGYVVPANSGSPLTVRACVAPCRADVVDCGE